MHTYALAMCTCVPTGLRAAGYLTSNTFLLNTVYVSSLINLLHPVYVSSLLILLHPVYVSSLIILLHPVYVSSLIIILHPVCINSHHPPSPFLCIISHHPPPPCLYQLSSLCVESVITNINRYVWLFLPIIFKDNIIFPCPPRRKMKDQKMTIVTRPIRILVK